MTGTIAAVGSRGRESSLAERSFSGLWISFPAVSSVVATPVDGCGKRRAPGILRGLR